MAKEKPQPNPPPPQKTKKEGKKGWNAVLFDMIH